VPKLVLEYQSPPAKPRRYVATWTAFQWVQAVSAAFGAVLLLFSLLHNWGYDAFVAMFVAPGIIALQVLLVVIPTAAQLLSQSANWRAGPVAVSAGLALLGPAATFGAMWYALATAHGC
jgi:hypothetical protein